MSFETFTLEELIIHLKEPHDIWAEVKNIVSLIFREFDFARVEKVFEDILKLSAGEYPGYQGCNTLYHDLHHTTQCLLVMAALIHGASLKGMKFGKTDVSLGLISALMHDTGYIQTAEDRTGTGAQYTLTHIRRSIRFMEQYFWGNGYTFRDFAACRNFLQCTGLDVKIDQIKFPSREHEILGKILGAADLIGQMADRDYLGKLPFLYRELQEGGVPGFTDEFDLLQKTPSFWESVQKRFVTELGQVDRYLRVHFRVRWGIDQDLYRKSIETNMQSLRVFLQTHAADYPRGDDFRGAVFG